MDLSLKGKRAIVCGSTQGIGKSIAIKLAEHGAAITLIARNEKKLIDVIGELKNTSSMEHNFIVSDFNDLNTLATSDIVTDLNLLATSAIVEDLNLLATSSVIADMAQLAGSGGTPNVASLTVSGQIAAASLDISGDVDVDGTLEADAMTLNGTAITTTATLSTQMKQGLFAVG